MKKHPLQRQLDCLATIIGAEMLGSVDAERLALLCEAQHHIYKASLCVPYTEVYLNQDPPGESELN